MSGRRTNLTLAPKAMFLVAVPLTFELVLLGFLCWLLHQSEIETRQADRSKAVISKTNHVMEACHNVGISFMVYDAVPVRTKAYFNDIYRTKVAYMLKSFHDLETSVKDNQEHLSNVNKCSNEAEECVKVLEKRKTAIDAGGRLDLVEALDLVKELKTIVKDLEGVIVDERAAQEARTTQSSGEALTKVLVVIFLSLILALLAVLGFQKGSDKRLKVLMDNSFRLGAGQPLAPLLEGEDEIAQIDRVFHDATNRLNEAAALKQQFVAMISHDLRTPLSAVKTTLELLGDQTWGELSEKAKNKIERAEQNLQHAIDLINNLLDLEKMQSGTIELRTEPVDLDEVLKRCANVVALLAERLSIAVLAIYKAIVEAHGGTIGVDGAPEKGSIFWFSIPEGGSL